MGNSLLDGQVRRMNEEEEETTADKKMTTAAAWEMLKPGSVTACTAVSWTDTYDV